MKKIFSCLAILGIVLLCLNDTSAMEVRITGDKLSVHADQVLLQDILEHMAGFGITIRIDPQLNPRVSASFEDRDLQKGLDSILKSLDHALIWEAIEGPLGPIPKLVEVQVFRPGKKDRMIPLGTRSVLAVARDPRDGKLFVKDEILLKLRQGISLSEFEKILRQIRGTVLDSNKALGIYKIRLPENSDVPSVVAQITNHPGIAGVEPNHVYPISLPDQNPVPTIPNSGLSYAPAPANAVPIAILDTGLVPDSGLSDLIVSSFDALNPTEPISDSLGHGTHMALLAAGVVKPYGVSSDFGAHSPIIAIRAFDDNGFTSNFGIMRSIDFALDNGARVMSLSWGSDTRSDFLESYFDYASSKGVIIVAAAGNEPTGKPVHPAAYPSVIGVGALGPDGRPWKNSNYGDFVNLYAPGFASFPVGNNGDPGTYSGTSISTAFVANIIGNYLSQNPKATTKEIFDALSKQF